MAVLLIACGTSTLKSPLLLGSDAPHVHLQLRKRLSRCTLDCGFKTSESPALRGFEAERCPITGTSLYLVLKSNGLHRPENLPVKFGFSPKSTSTNIAKKLPLQRCFKPLLIALFNFSHKRPTFAFTDENGYTLGSRRKIAHKGTHGETGGLPALGHSAVLCRQRNSFYSTTLLYTYISRFSVNPHYQQREKSGETAAINFIPNRSSSRFSTSHTNGPRLPSLPKAGTHSAFGERSHTRAYTAKQGAFQMGALLLPSDRFVRFGNPAWPGGRTANFAAFGSWLDVLPKNAESLRDSDALMRVAVPKASRPRWAA